MYFPFVCDPLDTGRNTEWREIEEGKEKKEKKKGKKRKWSRGAMVDLRHRRRSSPLLSAIRMAPVPATHDLQARPSPRPLLWATFLPERWPDNRIPRSAITFIQPLFHSFNLVALYKETLPLFLFSFLSLTPSNSFRCRHTTASSRIGKCAPWRIRKEGRWRRPSARPTLRGFEENMDTCWSKSLANQKLGNSVLDLCPKYSLDNLRLLITFPRELKKTKRKLKYLNSKSCSLFDHLYFASKERLYFQS